MAARTNYGLYAKLCTIYQFFLGHVDRKGSWIEKILASDNVGSATVVVDFG